MSKVYKQSPLFVPEKIVSGKPQSPRGWESVPFQKVQTNSAFIEKEKEFAERLPHEQRFSGKEEKEAAQPKDKLDFSAPDPTTKEAIETQTGESGDDLAIEDNPEPPDLELLREEAYNKGLEDGLARSEEDFGSSVKSLIMACREINRIRETILSNSMEEMQNLVLVIAEKIIRHSVTEQDRTIIDTVREAIQQAVKTDEFVIQVHPDDLATINTKSKEFIESVNGLENIIVRADSSIERGGCKIDSSTSTVDATIANQLQMIGNALKGK